MFISYKRKNYKPIILIVLLVLLQVHLYSYTPFLLRPINIYYGTSFRFDKTYRHVLTIDHWLYIGACTTSGYDGFGINSEYTNSSNFNFGFRYFRGPQIHNRLLIRFPIFFYSVSPAYYSINKHQGFTFAPELGFHYIYRFSKYYGASFFVYYGYDIPVINSKEYTISSHRLTLKIGLDYYRNKTRKETRDSTSVEKF